MQTFIREGACIATYIGTISTDRDTEAKKLEQIFWSGKGGCLEVSSLHSKRWRLI